MIREVSGNKPTGLGPTPAVLIQHVGPENLCLGSMLQNEKMLLNFFNFFCPFISGILWGGVIILGWIFVSLGLLVKETS